MRGNEELSNHFTAKEFRCRGGSDLPPDFAETIRDTVEFIERLRLLMNVRLLERTGKWHNTGIVIVSGHRNESYNNNVGGAKNSRHVTGQAADVRPTRSYDEVFSYSDFCELAELTDKTFPSRPYRLGFYPHKGAIAWIHVDCAYGFGGRRW